MAESKIGKNTLLVSAGVFLSRISGLIREQVFSGFFGAGAAMDSFTVAFRIPNLLRDLFGEGVLSTAFISLYVRMKQEKGKEAAYKFANEVLVSFLFFVGALVFLGIIFSQELIHLYTQPVFYESMEKMSLTLSMTKIMMPYLLFVSLSAVVMGILNTAGHYFIPSFASTFFNLGSVVVGVFSSFISRYLHADPIVGMAVGTLVGGVLQLIVQFPSLKSIGFKFEWRFNPLSPAMKQLYALMIPSLVGLTAVQINLLISNNFASSLPTGGISWLKYAFQLYQLPVGLFGVATGMAIMPLLSKYAGLKEYGKFANTYISGLTIAGGFSLPSAVGLYILANPLVHVIYQRGKFTEYDTQQTALALQFYLFGLLGYTLLKMTTPLYFALKRPLLPAISSIASVIVNYFFSVMFIGSLGHRGLALASSLSIAINFLILFIVSWRVLVKQDSEFSPWRRLKPLIINLAKIIVACIVMAVVLEILVFFRYWINPDSHFALDVGLILTSSLGLLVYGVFVVLLKVEELEDLFYKRWLKRLIRE